MAAAWVFSVMIAALASTVSAEAFLGARGQHVTKEAIEQALLLELPNSANIAKLTEELRPMYETLPKNEQGQLESSTVRYALHRYFVHKYGWYVKGLDLQGSAPKNTSSTEVMKGLAPMYIQGLFEERLHGRGLQLEELAVFAATLADLIFQEGLGSLREAYRKLELPTSVPLTEDQFDRAIRAYFAELVVGVFAEFHAESDFPTLETDAREVLAEYDDVIMWAQDLRKSRDWAERSLRNPFADQGVTWDRAAQHLQELIQNFGTLTRNECQSLKDKLLAMEAPGTGRILLSDFYANKQLELRESVSYLRNLGVLEEEGVQSPRLIMANYMTSVSRCTPFSNYFSICCHDECEDLMASLESGVKAPRATPGRIVEVVSGLSSGTKSAPWVVSSQMMGRLEQIASHHNGEVPLHGRLFMQWMHHAFPQECAFPHVSGTTSPVTQDEWLLQHEDLETVEALHDDIVKHTGPQRPDMHAGLDELPWSAVEELVASDKPSAQPRSLAFRAMRVAMCVIAIAAFALPLLRASNTLLACTSDDKTHLV